MPSGDLATTINRLKNTIAEYDNQLIKASNIIQTFDQKKHDKFFLQTKLDTIKNILESRELKANQLRDEVFDKPIELEELCATSYEFQDMYDQVVSSIRRFIDKIKPKPESNEPPPPPLLNLNLPVTERRNHDSPLKVSSSTPKSLLRKYEKPSQTEAFATTSDAGRPPIKCLMCERAPDINQYSEFLALTNEARWAQENPSRAEAFATTADAGRPPIKCPMCEKAHYINQCSEFLALTNESKWAQEKHLNYCTNCLSSRHTVESCRDGTCRECRQKHHSLLHQPKAESKPQPTATLTSQIPAASTTYTVTGQQLSLSTVMLVTYNSVGTPYYCRAILDSGSQSNVSTETLAQLLGRHKSPINMSVSGIPGKATPIRNKVNIIIKSRVNHYTANLECLVIPKITSNLPSTKIDISSWKFPQTIALADPQFGTTQQIDVLIGAESFYELFTNNQLKINNKLPPLQEAVFGWVISGKVASPNTQTPTFCGLIVPTDTDLQNQLNRFWEIDRGETPKPLSCEKKQVKNCTDTVKRQTDGQYVFTLSLKPTASQLRDSNQSALHRFYSLKLLFAKDPAIKAAYSASIDEYEKLAHMSPTASPIASSSANIDNINYDLPNHAVLKPDSSTTKLQVVFDGSAVTSTGLSLNDVLLTGPTIQQELLDIVLRSRKHRYAFTADISKLYKQIRIADHQHKLQPILWRVNPANIMSRGLMPNQLQNAVLWWDGPEFLNQNEEFWPASTTSPDFGDLPEVKSLITSENVVEDFPIINNCSRFPKLQRIMAYVFRFFNNVNPPKKKRSLEHLRADEMLAGLKIIVRTVQRLRFSEEIKSLAHDITAKSAAVKSMKYHLVRIVGKTQLYYEEMATVLRKIEAIMNSRPFFAKSNDPQDVTAITPGHFVIGPPIITKAEPNYVDINTNRLKRWQLLRKLTQQVSSSKRQQQPKNNNPSRIEIGMLILIKDDNLPPSHWQLCRVVQLHPGAQIRLLNRIIVKVCILPMPIEQT
jgi:hypothetical protein